MKIASGVSSAANQGRPDSSDAIVDALLATTFDRLPQPVVAAAKAGVLDTLGCVLAGTFNREVIAVGDHVESWGARPASTLVGRGQVKSSPEGAVLYNASAIHQYDFDDVHDLAPCHPSSTSVVPALALAESRGGVDGRALIRAVALGNDLTSRVSMAINGNVHDYPWFRAPVVGLFGATVASALVLGADRSQHLNALGLALPMVGGTFASLHHAGSDVRSLRDGLAYRNGVLAAELAMRGIRGDREVFDGPFGFFQSFFQGRYDRDRFTKGLGESFETGRVSLKPWPSIRHLHTTLTALLQVMEERDLAFEQIQHVLVRVSSTNRDRWRPVELGSIPALRMDLLGNLHFAVANMIRHRDIPLQVYRDAAMADDVIRHAMDKVTCVHDESLNGSSTFGRGAVEVTTMQGEVIRRECVHALGHPENPLSDERRHRKFELCAQAAARPLAPARVREIIDCVENLERLDDVAVLAALLA